MGVPSKLSRLPGACQKVLWWQKFWAKQPPKNWDCDKSTWLLSHQALSFVLLSLQYTADVSVKRVWSTSTKIFVLDFAQVVLLNQADEKVYKKWNYFIFIICLLADEGQLIYKKKYNCLKKFHVGIGLCTLNWNFTYQFILGTWFLNFNLVDFFVLVVLLWLWMILASKEAIAAEIFAKSGLLFSVIHLPKPKFIDLVLLSWLLYSCEK